MKRKAYYKYTEVPLKWQLVTREGFDSLASLDIK